MNMKKKTKKIIISLLASALFAIGLIPIGSGIYRVFAGAPVTIVYQAGSYISPSGEETDTLLFGVEPTEQVSQMVSKTVSDTLILPGKRFEDNVAADEIDSAQIVQTTELDSETFYFTGATDANDNQWAYTFVGWKIADATDKLPGETVFQPGDVIRPDTLTAYVKNDTLTLEALWAKCYFIQNQYNEMKYSLQDGLYKVDVTSSSGTTGASDTHLGNTPSAAKATVDGVYAAMRADLGVVDGNDTTVTAAQKNASTYDTYARAVVLVGDLDYLTDSNLSDAKVYGYATKPADDKIVAVSATYKSLGNANHTYLYKPKNYGNTVYGNIRFDNVNFKSPGKDFFSGQDNGVEFPLSQKDWHESANAKSYVEFTARYNATLSGNRAISTFRPQNATYVVVNGGTFGGMQNQYSSAILSGKQLYWTVGRNADIGTVNCGTTSAYEDNVINVYYNYNVYILGGKITNFYGGNNGANTIALGLRKIYLYGSDAGNQEYDPLVTKLYGGGSQSRLFGDITIVAKNCTKLGYVYGGGQDYSAVTYGNISITLENCVLANDLFGGGEFGNCESTQDTYIQYKKDTATSEKKAVSEELAISKLDEHIPLFRIDGKNLAQRAAAAVGGDVTIHLQGTHVKGNIFGSGKGATQILDIRTQNQVTDFWENVEDKDGNADFISKEENRFPVGLEDWESPVTGYPVYNEEDGRIVVFGYRDMTYTTSAKDIVSFYVHRGYAYLSLATVENVTMVIDGSTVGTNATNGKGNVYGGGSIAKVLEDTSITITNSTVWGSVYGGGDGVTTPEQVKVYRELTQEEYTAPYYTATLKSGSWGEDSAIYDVKTVKQSPSFDDIKNNSAYYELYTWSNDVSLLNGDTPGIDSENKLLYSPNTDGLGSVNGDTMVVINGGTVHGKVFGGGNYGIVVGTSKVTVKGGAKVENGVFGGGNGNKDDNPEVGKVTNATLTIEGTPTIGAVYGGGNYGIVENNTTVTVSGGVITDLFGGGNGDLSDSQFGAVRGSTSVTVSSGTIENAYGGSNLGVVEGNSAVVVSGDGTNVTSLFGGGNGNIADAQFGAVRGNTSLIISNGTIENAYGGSNLGKAYATNITVTGGGITSLFGGGNGNVENADFGSVTRDTSVTVSSGTIENAYGGSNLGKVGGSAVSVSGGTITKVFGGGNGNVAQVGGDELLGGVEGSATLELSGGNITEAYGGGNLGIVVGNTTVTVTGSPMLGTAFGGGNGDPDRENTSVLGAVRGDALLTVNMTTLSREEGEDTVITGGYIGTAYGGSNAADIGGAATLEIKKGVVTDGFGGNNVKGSISDKVTAKLSGGTVQGRLFGGGNKADYAGITRLEISGGAVGSVGSEQNEDGTVTGSAYGGSFEATVDGTLVTVTGGEIRSLFGGSYGADIGSDGINVTLQNTQITTFLGGNDEKGDVNGNINIQVGGSSIANASTSIINFFGGGNKANYAYGTGWTPSVDRDSYNDTPDDTFQGITIHIYSGDIYQAFGGGVMAAITNARTYVYGGEYNFLYGGGYKGAAAYTVIHLSGGSLAGKMLPQGLEGDPPFAEQYGGYAFGGGYQGYVMSASIHLEEKEANGGQPLSVGHSLFGGGNKADVGETHVVIKSGKVVGSVYGGGFEGDACMNADKTINEEYQACVRLYGGDIGSGQTYNGRTYIGNVYGGGYLGTSHNTHVDVSAWVDTSTAELNLRGNVYGGGHEADIVGDTHIHFLGGDITGNVYGGGRNGHVVAHADGEGGNTYVDVLAGSIGGSVYGGGYLGEVQKTHVLISNKLTAVEETGEQTLIEAFNAVMSDPNLTHDIQIGKNVFGGGEGEAATTHVSTLVRVHMNRNITATETPVTTGAVTSGEITTTVHFEATGSDYTTDSHIGGSVFGGGDLGMVGSGDIQLSNNTVTDVVAGSTTVELENGYIKGNVYGGGSGDPEGKVDENGVAETYNVYMGTVFGATNVLVSGGYIQGNVFGGGKQSRVYSGDPAGLAAHVTVEEAADRSIILGGSVFGGGERGSSVSVNASSPTTLGNVRVDVLGLPDDVNPGITRIYFEGREGKGGVYGDGNLCLVEGHKEVFVQNLNMGADEYDKLKTFYSLQRADLVTLDNSAVVLLGAIDLVEEGDSTTYSVNRVDKISMEHGSTFKLDKIVKYLGELESDVTTDRKFINGGNNGTNNYANRPITALTDEEIDAYHAGNWIARGEKNVVCVANGLYLDVQYDNGTWGGVYGLFTLQLLFANPGEGGGFVYADIAKSTGDFICDTVRGFKYVAHPNLTKAEFEANPGKYYTRGLGGVYEPATTYDEIENTGTTATLYYERVVSSDYMKVVDNVGGFDGHEYTFYFWYINGDTITYHDTVTGYIGAQETQFALNKTIPQHEEILKYVLFGVQGNEVLLNAVTGAEPTYTLVSSIPNGGLIGQQIAIELKNGEISLGFLSYDAVNGWGVALSATTAYGYQGEMNLIGGNTLYTGAVTANSTLSIVLHKSTGVNTELSGMSVTWEMDLYYGAGNATANENDAYTNGTSTLIFEIGVAIVRLVPEQSRFTDSNKDFAGVANSGEVFITGQSAFTVEYQTKYIPIAFPEANGDTMTWTLSTKGYSYYMDDYGHYLTLDTADRVVNKSEGFTLLSGTFDNMNDSKLVDRTIFKYSDGNGENYYCRFTQDNEQKTELMKLNDNSTKDSYLPKNTKITLIDLTGEVPTPTYYYYIVRGETAEFVNLKDFIQMGTTQAIENATEANKPAFIKAYEQGEASRVFERLVFIFDFAEVDWTTAEFDGEITLHHWYGNGVEDSVDIMDYVNAPKEEGQSYTRSAPQKSVYHVNESKSGLDEETGHKKAELEKNVYYDKDTITLNVHFEEDGQWVNTQYKEGEYSLKLELIEDPEGLAEGVEPSALPFPVGMTFTYKENTYHPGVNRTYVVIPLEKSGDHTIVMNNLLFSMMEAMGGNEAHFRVTLYSAPDANYYNSLTSTLTKDSLVYTIQLNPEYGVSANASDRIVAAGEALTVDVLTSVVGAELEARSVSVALEMKDENGEYQTAAWTDVFDGAAPTVTANGATTLSLRTLESASAGTYRIKIEYGDCVEYFYYVVS